ncbi:hypothetical protein ACRTDU_02835 [Sunxiuqinia elliptica]
MKATIEPGFSEMKDRALSEKLTQLTREFPIAFIFYSPRQETSPARILIIPLEGKHARLIESRKWIRNDGDKNKPLLHVISLGKMAFEYRAGNPFIACYCQKSAIIYQSPQAGDCPDTDWPSIKNKFKKYTERYYHDREILLSAATRFQQLGSLTGTHLTYLSAFEHTIRYLETLYAGHSFDSSNLHQRIKYLSYFIPSIEKGFVKKNSNEYYLVSELERGKEAAEYGDEVRLNENLFDSIAATEFKLYQFVSDRFSALKRQIKSGGHLQAIVSKPKLSPEDKELARLITLLQKMHPVEEVYLFHQSQHDRTTTYFLLLIGEGLGTAILNRVQQSVEAKTGGQLAVVLIGHSLTWIQTNLFYHQAFFQKIMLPVNRKFQSHPNHPSIHWENPYTPNYPDLEYYYSSSIKMAKQYFVLRTNATENNTEGLSNLFGQSVLGLFRTYIFAKLSYLPNYLPAYSLWELCVYAEPRFEKVEFLFEKCCGESFFKTVDEANKFHHRISNVAEEKLLVMDEILNLLLEELETACKSVKGESFRDVLIHSDTPAPQEE